MSEHITHVAIYEDTVRLASHGNILSGIVDRSLRKRYDIGLCATASRGNYMFAVPFLEDVLVRRRRGENLSDSMERMIAASMGWLAHRASDYQLDDVQVPLLEALRREEGLDEAAVNIDEHQIYLDAILFDKVYDGGNRAPKSPHHPFSPALLERHMESHPGAGYVDVEAVELLFGAFWQRRQLELHRFASSEADIDTWMDEAIRRRQDFSEDLRLYVEAFQRPDPDKMRYYIEALNFYDDADPVIALARALQRGEARPDIDVEQAVQAGAEQSVYARGLSMAYRNVQTANRFLEGVVTKRQLYDQINTPDQHRY